MSLSFRRVYSVLKGKASPEISALGDKYGALKKILDEEKSTTETVAINKVRQSQSQHVVKGLKKDIKMDGPKLNERLAKYTEIPMKFKAKNEEYTAIASFLSLARVNLDWSVYDYEKIPGEAERVKNSSDVNIETQNVVQETHVDLPEVMFLGRCNVGKSSLINAILSKKKQLEIESYARVKETAGYTPCLNFYNVGGRFRLVDSPGYGVKGREWQGELVFKYLQNRRNLQNCYLILDAEIGINAYDELILQNLTQAGVRFDIIFNKIDKIPVSKRMGRMVELVTTGIVGDLNIKPRCYCVSCKDDERSGVTEVMVSVLESCNLPIGKGLVANVKKRVVRADLERAKYRNAKKSERRQQKQQKKSSKGSKLST